jgi:acyl carrier protein
MRDSAIFEKLTECVRTLFDEYDGPVTPQLNAAALKQWDSLANVHLIVMVEQIFGIWFTTEEIQKLENLGQIAELVANKKRTDDVYRADQDR